MTTANEVTGAADGGRYLTTAEAASRLGVKPETVYAYVSRGLLRSVRSRERRGSLFRQDDVDNLAQRGREGRPPSGVVERIGTGVSLLEDDQLFYRGHVATDLAAGTGIEAVARLLWTGEFAEHRPGRDEPFTAPDHLVAAARAAVAALPSSARLTDRLRVVVAVLGAADPLRFDLSAESVTGAARAMLGAMVEVLSPHTAEPLFSGEDGDVTAEPLFSGEDGDVTAEPLFSGEDGDVTAEPLFSGEDGDVTARGDPLATRFWPALTSQPAQPELLNTALVLLADHGLAVSTVAARVAASARAHPYAVVSAGLGAVDAQYHGGASGLAFRFLADAMRDPVGALSEWLRSGQVPGYGHRVYQDKDPRFEFIMDSLRRFEQAEPVLAVVDTITTEMGRRGTWPPNVDLALAALAHAFQMRPDAPEAVFAVARTIGWLAHALEEYREPRLRFRPLGVYTGVRPGR